MIRHAAAVAIALVLSPSWLCAQTDGMAEFTVKVQSATIYKGPSTATPAIGRAPRGTVLVVSRDLGSWFKVSWPDADDGVGYVHQSLGTLANRATRAERLASTVAPATAPAQSASPAIAS